MNLTSLSDCELLERTESLVREEREILTNVLHHLREIDARRLFSSLKYKSLFDYAVKHLKYSADQAARRIAAMRLLRDMPELESKIESGALTLTNLSLAQNLFRKENLLKSDRVELLKTIENKSTREAERIVISRSSAPATIAPDRIRPVSTTHLEIKFIASEELNQKIEKLKGLLAHRNVEGGIAGLVNFACDITIERLTRQPKSKENLKSLGAPRGHRVTKSVAAEIKREVWRRAGHKCQNCESDFRLEVDHIEPKVLGGGNRLDNLRLLCRSCNQRAAVEKLGLNKMRGYFERSKN